MGRQTFLVLFGVARGENRPDSKSKKDLFIPAPPKQGEQGILTFQESVD